MQIIKTITYDQADMTLEWATWCLSETTFHMEDYKELCELVVIFLGGVVLRKS